MPRTHTGQVMLNHFIARNVEYSPVNFLDIATSHDGFHISGWPSAAITFFLQIISACRRQASRGLPPEQKGAVGPNGLDFAITNVLP